MCLPAPVLPAPLPACPPAQCCPPPLCRRIAVVTSEFHMPRTQATFDFIYQLAGRQLHGDPAWYCLDYRPGGTGGLVAAACWLPFWLDASVPAACCRRPPSSLLPPHNRWQHYWCTCLPACLPPGLPLPLLLLPQ